MLTLISSMIVCFFMKASTYQCQCVTEIPDGTEFSINVTRHIRAESDECIRIPYEFTYPINKVTVPYTKIWFKGDPRNDVNQRVVQNLESKNKDMLKLNGLPQGEHEYGFKLEWGCNQTYIFPERVQISVSALTLRPIVIVPPLTEGTFATLRCFTSVLCTGRPQVQWKWTKADGHSKLFHSDYQWVHDLSFTPKAEDHNSNITCITVYRFNTVEKTVTLTVKSHPKFLNDSQCIVQGTLLTCVCISQGIPPPPITWPLASLRDYSVISSGSIQTVSSTITMSTTEYHNSSVKCISTNELGQAEIELPLQNHTVELTLTYVSDWMKNIGAARITACLSIILNFALLSSLIITWKRGKSRKKKSIEEESTYVSLSMADVQQEYSVIFPRTR